MNDYPEHDKKQLKRDQLKVRIVVAALISSLLSGWVLLTPDTLPDVLMAYIGSYMVLLGFAFIVIFANYLGDES